MVRGYRASIVTAGASVLGLCTGCPPGGGGDEPAPQFETPQRSSTIAITTDDRRVVTANRETNTVTILEVRDEDGNDVANKLAELGVGDEPRFVALTPDDETAFVTNTASGMVSVISLGETSFAVEDEIEVGSEPRGCAVTPNGTLLFVANHTSGTVSVIDTETRDVIETIDVPGFPQAIAITNDGDDEDDDETVFVTEFYARLIEGGPGEAFNDGKEAFVNAISVGDLDGDPERITLSPIEDAGFNGDVSAFCQQINANAANNTFCPDTAVTDATDPAVADVTQGAHPNQLHAALVRGNRLFIPNTAASPEPPLRFNVNVQALVSVVDVAAGQEAFDETVNINAQIKLEEQPDEAIANTVLDRLFGGDMVAIDADAEGENFLLVSRGGNYVLRASLNGAGVLDIDAPDDVVRFQTGNLPTGVVISSDGERAYTNNEANVSVSALNLQNNSVIAQDIATGEPPAPGTFEHGVLVGKLCFFTSLGIPDNGIFDTPIRDFEPLAFRNKASDNGWSSCSSCHPDGLADGVTWIFATGPRQTLSLDGFFAKDNPGDQRISNWNAVRGSVTDFNENSVAVQGGIGFAGDPASPDVYNHGITSGASDALDAQTLWVQTVRAPILPDSTDDAAIDDGREVFAANCASCHGGPKWTKSQVIYADNPAFDDNPLLANNPGQPRDAGVTNAGAQVVSYTVEGNTLTFIENVGTFNAALANEIRSNAVAALGGIGFNVPSLLGVSYHAPYFHSGAAQSLEDVFDQHGLPGGTIASQISAAERAALLEFLQTIDGATDPFTSDTDAFRLAIE